MVIETEIARHKWSLIPKILMFVRKYMNILFSRCFNLMFLHRYSMLSSKHLFSWVELVVHYVCTEEK